MKQTLVRVLLLSLMVLATVEVSAQWNDSIRRAVWNEYLQDARNPEDSALRYHIDFVYCHGGYENPWIAFDLSEDTTRIPAFPHSAESAIAIMYRLYHQDQNEYKYLYYPIVQLEHFLGLEHDTAVVFPDTSDYYMPLKSGAYDELNLGPGWETDYSQHLMLYSQWAFNHCECYTRIFKTLDEPDLWHQRQDTVLRLTVAHLPSSSSSVIRVYMDNGKPTAILYDIYSCYSEKNSSWYEKVDKTTKKRLKQEQWQEILKLATAIDTLPWKDKGETIDGNRYQFEYRHGTSYHSHYSCWDKTGLWEYLYNIFYKKNGRRRR